MIAVLKRLTSRLINLSLALCLGLSLLVTACGNESSTLTGDYVQDTIAVAHTIHDTLALPQDAANRQEAEGEARDLITDYVSRYRARPKVERLEFIHDNADRTQLLGWSLQKLHQPSRSRCSESQDRQGIG